MSYRALRSVAGQAILSAALVLALAAAAPGAPGQVEKGQTAGEDRARSAEDRRLLVEAENLDQEVAELWRENPEDALSRAEKVVEIRRKVLGAEHPDYAASLDGAARIYKLLGDLPRAKSFYEQALSIRRRVLGEEHPDYRASLKNLAGLYYLMEEDELARSLFDEASRIEKRLEILGDIGRPAAWMAIRSYAAIEEALRALSRVASGAADSDDLIELLKRKTGGLDGLDRTRPVGISLPVLGATGMLGIVFSIPYSDREKIIADVLRFFPVLSEQGGILRFDGGPVPAFGRVEESDSLLLLSTVAELLPSPHGRVPADLFTDESGPAVVMHLDFEVALSLRSSPLKDIEDRLLDRLQSLGARLAGGDPHYEELFRKVFTESARRLIDSVLDDLATGDVRIRLAGDWQCDLEIRARPRSETASFLSAQSAGRLRLPVLSSRDRVAGVQLGFHLTDGLRKGARQWLTSLHEWAATNPPPMEDSTAAAYEARVEVAPKLLSICEQLLGEATIDSGCDMAARGGETSMVFWVRGARCGSEVLELSELAHRGIASAGGQAALVPGSERHGNTPIHLIRGDGGAEDPIYVAAEDHFFLIGLGASVQPLKAFLDLSREQGPLPPGGRPRAFCEMDLSLARLAEAGFTGAPGDDQPMAAAFRAGLVQGPDAPFAASLRITETGFALDARWPEALLPALAAALRAGLEATPEPPPGSGSSETE